MKSYIKFVVTAFFSWRIFTLLLIFLAVKFVDLQRSFLGGGLDNYLSNPYLWSLANFDGEHFLSISQNGYGSLNYFFFPLYPILMKFITGFFSNTIANYLYSGIFISHLFFFFGLLGFHKLLSFDFKSKFSKLVIILLLIFPTSFYFGSIYSESLFFFLCIWSFYFVRKKNFLIAGILASLATATRLVGIALIIPIIYEFMIDWKRNINFKNILGIIILPLGLTLYMYYLWIKTGDPIIFFNAVDIFGEQRQSSIILLPQVFYRYFFKLIPNLNLSYFSGSFFPILELSIAILFLLILIFSFKTMRRSYWIFLLIGYLIPTFSGSFSSLPRYVVVLFPAFIYLASFLNKNNIIRFLFFGVSLLTLIVSITLFSRGYWIA